MNPGFILCMFRFLSFSKKIFSLTDDSANPGESRTPNLWRRIKIGLLGRPHFLSVYRRRSTCITLPEDAVSPPFTGLIPCSRRESWSGGGVAFQPGRTIRLRFSRQDWCFCRSLFRPTPRPSRWALPAPLASAGSCSERRRSRAGRKNSRAQHPLGFGFLCLGLGGSGFELAAKTWKLSLSSMCLFLFSLKKTVFKTFWPNRQLRQTLPLTILMALANRWSYTSCFFGVFLMIWD